jgi:hypothetical protein
MLDSLPPAVFWVFGLTTLATVVIYLAAVRARHGRVGLTAAVLVFLLGVHGWLGAAGFYLVETIPPRFPLAPLPSTLILLALMAATRFGAMSPGVMRLLVVVSVVRVPVEVVLWSLSRHGFVPELRTFEGRNFDILSGLSAPLVAWLAFRGGAINRPVLIAWHLVALALLLNIVTIAILSLETPFQRLAFNQPNRGVLYFPFIWLPAVVVPVVFVSHVESLWRLVVAVVHDRR